MIGRKVIYSEPQDVFRDVLTNQVASKMEGNHSEVSNGKVKDSEYRSWQNSPVAIKSLLELSGVKDTFVTFEYLVPYTQRRIDCMLYGKNSDSKGYVVHIELKQWDKAEPTNIEGNWVEIYTGRPNNRVAHPSQQIKGYHDYLKSFVEVFEEDKMGFFGLVNLSDFLTKPLVQDLGRIIGGVKIAKRIFTTRKTSKINEICYT